MLCNLPVPASVRLAYFPSKTRNMRGRIAKNAQCRITARGPIQQAIERKLMDPLFAIFLMTAGMAAAPARAPTVTPPAAHASAASKTPRSQRATPVRDDPVHATGHADKLKHGAPA